MLGSVICANLGTAVVALAALSILFQDVSALTCSMTANTPDAVEECVNAVRTKPGEWIPLFDNCQLGSMKPAPELIRDWRLQSAADSHTLDLAASSRTSHYGNDGSFVKERVVDRAGFDGNHIGENVAGGFDNAFAVVHAWMCSEGHRKAIMNCNHNVVGTGVRCNNEGRCFYTQDFGCFPRNTCSCDPKPSPPKSPPPPPPPSPPPPSPPPPKPSPSPSPKPAPKATPTVKPTPPKSPPPSPSPKPKPKPVPSPSPPPVRFSRSRFSGSDGVYYITFG